MQVTALAISTPRTSLATVKRKVIRRDPRQDPRHPTWSETTDLAKQGPEIFDAEFEELPTNSVASRYDSALRPSVMYLGRSVDYYA